MMDAVERYLSLHRTAGFDLINAEYLLASSWLGDRYALIAMQQIRQAGWHGLPVKLMTD